MKHLLLPAIHHIRGSETETAMHHRETDLSHFRKPLVKWAMVQIVSRPFPCSNSADCYLQSSDNCSEAKHQPTDTYREITQLGSSSAQFLATTARDKGAHAKDRQTYIRARVRRMSEIIHTHILTIIHTCKASSITLSLGGLHGQKQCTLCNWSCVELE